jgi:hypothetical protein
MGEWQLCLAVFPDVLGCSVRLCREAALYSWPEAAGMLNSTIIARGAKQSSSHSVLLHMFPRKEALAGLR